MDNQRELTKEDIRALRTCDRVVVKIDGEIATVRCIKEVKAMDGFTSADPYTTLQAEYEILTQGGMSKRYRTASCFLSFTDFGAWGLLVKSLRTGDKIVFTARENGNGYINGVLSGKTSDIDNNIDFTSLHYDEMCLTIYRKGKVFADKVVFEHSICPSNTARMLQA
tara:strand:+ start:861 stop:1361 length:501 start_codon:yes stop_codon:yes gene_type:complete